MTAPTGWPFVIADVFTDVPLAGNQLAVFTDAGQIPERWLQPLAREMNFSESVFVYPEIAEAADAGVTAARIRIFMPNAEIPFAGHPIIGAAHVIAAGATAARVRLRTGIGDVEVAIERDAEGVPCFGWMSQPVPTSTVVAGPSALFDALGIAASELPVTVYDNGMHHLYIRLADADAVMRLRPNFGALAAATLALLPGGAGINCFGGAGTAWTTRMFAPDSGIDEDPATGSAAGPLAVHLLRHGVIASGETITIAQGAAVGRPSTLVARVEGEPAAITSVTVGGAAVLVAQGEFDGARIMR